MAGVLVSSACEKVPLLAPSLTTITLSAGSMVVQANGSTEISATLLEQSGTPVQNGTTVTFTTNLGTMEPKEARTFNGTATVRFVATGQSGEAEIRAASGGAKPSDTANPSIKIKVGAAAAARVQVTASPSRVGASGGSSTVTATVSDTNGNPLGGVVVTFTADAGALSSSVATTSLSGQASVTLTTTREATVTATAGPTGTAAAATGTVKVTVGSLPTLALAVVTPNPVEGQVVSFTLTATGSATTDPFQSVVVDFGNGVTQNLGPLTGTTQLTQTYSADGTYIVRATGTGFNGDTTQATAFVTVTARPPIPITIAVTPANPVAGSIVTVTVTVTAPTGGAVIQSVSLDFGDGTSGSMGAFTGANSVPHTYNTPGTYTIRATATDNLGSSNSVVTQVVVSPRVPPAVTITTTSAGPFTTVNPVTFTASVTPSTTSILRVDWNFGDGTTATTTGLSTSHKYSQPSGPSGYTVTVTVTTTDGNTGTGQIQIAVPT